MTFGFVIVYSLPRCVRWALNLVYTRCTKERCKNKYGDAEQSVHRKTSPKPLVVTGCFKPSGIIFISLPNPTFCLFFLAVVLDLDSTLSPFPLPSVSEECGDSVLLRSASSSGARVWSTAIVSNQSPAGAAEPQTCSIIRARG